MRKSCNSTLAALAVTNCICQREVQEKLGVVNSNPTHLSLAGHSTRPLKIGLIRKPKLLMKNLVKILFRNFFKNFGMLLYIP